MPSPESGTMPYVPSGRKPKVCAVSYLNTTPLVWGLLHGPQQGRLDLQFEIPSVCAALLESGEVDVGLVPAIELERQPLEFMPGLGIASRGAVRSILLISKVAAGQIETLTVDASSRTSVVLARILLAELFDARPRLIEGRPDLTEMLRLADACLVIGDPALRVERETDGLRVYDLGSEWSNFTGLPMVYAVWAARAGFDWRATSEVLWASWEFGRDRIDQIAVAEADGRGVSSDTAREYLTRNIHFELSDDYMEGLALFRRLARSAGAV